MGFDAIKTCIINYMTLKYYMGVEKHLYLISYILTGVSMEVGLLVLLESVSRKKG